MTSQFRKGSSTYNCSCCGHLTRYTGNQSVDSKLCDACYELAGYENQEQDDDISERDVAQIVSLFNEIRARGEGEFQKALKSHDMVAKYYTGASSQKYQAIKHELDKSWTQAQKKAYRAKARKAK